MLFRHDESIVFVMTNLAIKEQAKADQQAGIPLMRGRDRYEAIADRAAYANAWLESVRVNGVVGVRK